MQANQSSLSVFFGGEWGWGRGKLKLAMFRVMSPFVINLPNRDLLVPYTKWSFQIMVGILALQLQGLWTRNIAIFRPGVRNRWNCQSIKIDANRYHSITINRLILEINEQSMKEDFVTFKWNNSQIKHCQSMEIDVISGQFYVTIDWSSIDQYQSIPIN